MSGELHMFTLQKLSVNQSRDLQPNFLFIQCLHLGARQTKAKAQVTAPAQV